MTSRSALVVAVLVAAVAATSGQQTGVTFERLLRTADEPQNWLTYSGDYASLRYSTLTDITPANVSSLEQQWLFQAQSLESFEATPLVVDGVMYLTQAPNDVVALDAATGRVFWVYRYRPSQLARLCCGRVNRGLAILGNTLFMGTIDAKLVAIDATSGAVLWITPVGDPALGYAITHAPLVIKDKVIVGVAGGELGIRGFIAAYDSSSGKEAWRFWTVAGPGDPGFETWTRGAENGGGPVWLTGSYDPALNLTYWGIGNPSPDFNPALRPGDNLYTNSVVALDADTGTLRWHFQFTPNDAHDRDAVQIPVLIDTAWRGARRSLMLWGNRNGFFYVLDRVSGEFLAGYPFVEKMNWASGLDAAGHPVRMPLAPDAVVFPGVQGATNWYSPSYSPRTGLFYMTVWENYGSVLEPDYQEFTPGQFWLAGRIGPAVPGVASPGIRRGPINTWTEESGHGEVIALDPATGERAWTFRMTDVSTGGILATASDVVFTGGREGFFYALEARSGRVLWKAMVGGPVVASPITYAVRGRQYVAVPAGNVLFTWALGD